MVNETASLPQLLSGGGANNRYASKQMLNYLPGQELPPESRAWGEELPRPTLGSSLPHLNLMTDSGALGGR